MINRVIKKLDSIVHSFNPKITSNLKSDIIGNSEMDSCNVYLGIFKQNKENPYIVYSAGIGDQINFELDLLKRLKKKNINVELYAIDPTPKALQFLTEQELPENFHILPYALSDRDEMLQFALPQTDGWVSGSCVADKNDERNLDFENTIVVDGRCISSIMKEFDHKRIDLLKMDIEGSEFDVLEDALNSDIQIGEMCIEFHDNMMKDGYKKLKKVLSLLYKKYDIFYARKKFHTISCIRKNI